MVNPLTSIKATNHPLGNELKLEWVVPAVLPTNYRLYIFKNIAVITDEQITAYFAGEETKVPVTYIEPDSDGVIVDGILDMNVDTGKHYYYRLLIRDTDSEELSTTVDVDAVVTSTFTADAVDCKELVISAIKRILNNYQMTEWKEYEIKRQWTAPTTKNSTIYVLRAPNQVVQRYLGEMIPGGLGQIDQDNIEVIWQDPNHKRIETFTNLFRYSKSQFKRYMKTEDILDIEIVMGGDAVDVTNHDRIEPTASMLVHCQFEVQETYLDQAIHPIYSQELTIQPNE